MDIEDHDRIFNSGANCNTSVKNTIILSLIDINFFLQKGMYKEM